jgi:hypothetical protein
MAAHNPVSRDMFPAVVGLDRSGLVADSKASSARHEALVRAACSKGVTTIFDRWFGAFGKPSAALRAMWFPQLIGMGSGPVARDALCPI